MRQHKNGKTTYSGDDIAAAFGYPAPSTRCTDCPHARYEHRREVVTPGFNGSETSHECQAFDGRTKTGHCKCSQFTEPAAEPEVSA